MVFECPRIRHFVTHSRVPEVVRGTPLRQPPAVPGLAPHPPQAARPSERPPHVIPLKFSRVILATDTDFGIHKSAPQAHFSPSENTDKINSKNNFRAEGALTFECQRRTYGTLVFRCPRSRQIVADLRAPETVGGTLLRPPPSPPGLAPHPQQAARPSERADQDIPLTYRRVFLATDTIFGTHKSAPQAHFSPKENTDKNKFKN